MNEKRIEMKQLEAGIVYSQVTFETFEAFNVEVVIATQGVIQ